MDEAWVKAAALSWIRDAAGRGRKPVITAEFSLGDSGVRADLAVFSDELIGLEIKTERDTLRRLPSQMEAYSQFFHHAVAIVAPCHLSGLTADHLRGASLWTYNERGVLRELRRGQINPVSECALESVLTQAERRKFDFNTAMAGRYAATSKVFWQTVSRRSIKADDLKLLSRFADGREQAKRFAAQRQAHWSDWLAAQGC